MELKDFFKLHNKIALAFSGGADSAYLLYAALSCGADVKAYYIKSQFQPEFEHEDARKLAIELGADLTVINIDILKDEDVRRNSRDRCYYCKKQILSAITERASSDGYYELMDGTNASDDSSDRPGMRALKEAGVFSPLRDCGITKAALRRLSEQAGLFTWNKPAYACLATRLPAEVQINPPDLERTEKSEDALRDLGLTDFRVRCMGSAAKLQVKEAQLQFVLQNREKIISILSKYYNEVLLDLKTR